MARSHAGRRARHPGGTLAAAGRAPRGSRRLTPRRAAWLAGATLLVLYGATLAPTVTFWDAGELIAAIRTLGIPHPPGTPLYVALGHVWTQALGGVLGVARAANLLSAVCTALAGALTSWLLARRVVSGEAGWTGYVGAVAAGTMMTAWSNATETEVYSLALLHAVAILAAASRCGDAIDRARERWMLLTAYLLVLTPATHLSALVAAPAAVMLASLRPESDATAARWRLDAVLLLGGTTIVAAGVGRMQWLLVAAGVVVAASSARCFPSAQRPRRLAQWLLVAAIAASALLMLLVRARHDPAINQGDPSSLGALADVIARRQYAVAPLLPRSAPVWLQIANVFQYVDWQAAMGWGAGVVTSPLRVLATCAWLALAAIGFDALRMRSRNTWRALGTLAVAGTLGVAAYLNLKAGASLGWGILPDDAPHEARERDYFFLLGFWAWGCVVGAGAVALVRRRGWPASAATLVLVLPIAGNWRSADRARAAERDAARDFAVALLEATPRDGVLFVDGDNDSYPIWYAQQVEGRRRDVLPVTVPLLPASWYPAEISRRSGLRWTDGPVTGAQTLAEQRAAQIAAAAHAAGRPVAVSPALSARERRLLGSTWVLRGPVYVAQSGGRDARLRAEIDRAAAARFLATLGPSPTARSASGDDVARIMLGLLECPRLALDATLSAVRRDSLEVKCNLR